MADEGATTAGMLFIATVATVGAGDTTNAAAPFDSSHVVGETLLVTP